MIAPELSLSIGVEHSNTEVSVKDGTLEDYQTQQRPRCQRCPLRDIVVTGPFEHSKLLLSKEWLVKVDAQTSKPYLFKFYSSSVDPTCCFLITDTKKTWAEVLNNNQFARRWRECNERISSPFLDDDAEEAWRTRNLEILSRAHTLGTVSDLSFELAESKKADLAFELGCDTFKWRWDTIFVGHKASADILSQHLIMPLISVNHLAFSTPDVVGDLGVEDLEKAVDKIGRTARWTVDTHIKNALSKPRLATTLRRMTAVFNFISDLPKITTAIEVAPLQPREPTPKLSAQTEPSRSTGDYVTHAPSPVPSGARSRTATKLPLSSDTDSSPLRPAKKSRPSPASDEDSEEERKKLAAQIKSGAASIRGTRQPLRRGGRRF
ncbi:hypothetical protein PISMIDRAFT_31213 [Pisolithus microcarpus 441]|uniref:XLF-like N-terminal domain-containing protein n=1 Tax=Pisolithus microcarpus 441 TaxID=765257 RepID=A0A0C9YRP8_9AGAM|nr:hypothetical protein PISMIDRAFT_31213 [Pisolithus microcarpus 441]